MTLRSLVRSCSRPALLLAARRAGARRASGITPLSPKAGATVPAGKRPTFKMRVKGAGQVWVHVCKSKKKDSEGVICRDESIGQRQEEGRHVLRTSRSSSTSPSSGSTRRAPTTGRRTASQCEGGIERLPAGGPDRQVQGRVDRRRAPRPHRLLGLAVPRLARRGVLPAEAAAAPLARALPDGFDTVEVNSTFYRLAKPEAVARWVAETPPGFVFTVKASRYMTHVRRLHGPRRGARALLRGDRAAGRLAASSARCCGSCRANFKRDEDRLADALERLPPGRHCFEFRHESWFTDDVLAILRAYGAALVYGDHPERPGSRWS